MPSYKGHLVGGTVFFGIVFYFIHSGQTSMVTAFEWLGFTLAGALFPDIDVKSKGQKYFYWVLLLLFLVLINQRRYALLAIVSVLSVTPMLARHRGLFHKIWFVVGAPFLLWVVMRAYFPHMASTLFFDTAFFVLGALSHLLLDLGPRRMFKV